MRVEMHGKPEFLAQCLDQLERRVWPTQSGHVLDAQHVGTHVLEPGGEVNVVIQAVLGPIRIEDVARVADRGLADRAGAAHGVHRDTHVVDIVERIEDAEYIDALASRLDGELPHDVIGIAGVANRVRGSQQHLEANVRDFPPQQSQALPRILVEESQRRVERGASPHLETEKIGEIPGHGWRGREQVVGAHPRSEQRLVGVAKRRVGDQ